MAVPPYVATRTADEPRTELGPPPARAWRADRPGELGASQPSGAMLGSPGPDLGYVLSLLVRFRDRLQLDPLEHSADVEAVAAEIAMRRASGFGRAPTSTDLEVGFTILGVLGMSNPEQVAWRRPLVHDAAHHYEPRRATVDAVDPAVLRLSLETVRSRAASDWRSLFIAAPEH